ncbi:DUF1499 domain-containing protein [Actibacterium sp. MT2.3-13A]|uniref:DUF1499 domain-containing protein n=1 Tax=Actibacterium sp. MT2.3-13A TaxID=2828332 RepID=UPI001BABCD88|nr:DUF1499 domain-containing protein [Actibacterium sp. MT2.3-13A]
MPDIRSFRPGLAGLLLGLAAIVMVAASAFGYRQGWWPVLRALALSEYAVYAAALGVGLSLLALVLRLGRRGGGAVLPLAGLIVGLPILMMGIGWEVATRTTPPINDISTDTEDPPVFWDTPTPTDYPAGNAELQRGAYPRVVPLDLPISAGDAFALAAELVRERGWEVLAEDAGEGRIEAVATSALYGFKDEIAIRVSETDAGARIDLRSRSRIGQIDRGANARRITAFLDDLAARARP